MRFRFQGLEFGSQGPRHSALFVSEFEIGEPEERTSDTNNEGRDGVLAGRDFFGKRPVTMTVHSHAERMIDAHRDLSRLLAAWRDPEIRRQTGRVVPLEYQPDGVSDWRCFYGRPRQSKDYDFERAMIQSGVGTILLRFEAMDHRSYGPVREWELSPGDHDLVMTGDEPAPATVKFIGPASSPYIEADGWHIGIRGNIDSGDHLTIDPMAGTVRDRWGRNYPARADRRTRVYSAAIPPGEHDVTVSGASVEISVRPAYSAP